MSGWRAVFFDEGAARRVAARLGRDGFSSDVRRERFAGEDDDEDQPWVVLSDAPAVMVELMVEEHDGWLEVDAPPPRPTIRLTPLDLPAAPRRRHRPGDPDGTG